MTAVLCAAIFNLIVIELNIFDRRKFMMEDFIGYLTQQIGSGKEDITRLEKEERKDEADFVKVRTNIYEVCKTVTNALAQRPGMGLEAVSARFDGFRKTWGEALDKAREHGDTRNIVIGETKLEVLEDVIAHFAEVAK